MKIVFDDHKEFNLPVLREGERIEITCKKDPCSSYRKTEFKVVYDSNTTKGLTYVVEVYDRDAFMGVAEELQALVNFTKRQNALLSMMDQAIANSIRYPEKTHKKMWMETKEEELKSELKELEELQNRMHEKLIESREKDFWNEYEQRSKKGTVSNSEFVCLVKKHFPHIPDRDKNGRRWDDLFR